ncbi:MAG: flavodoxin family protein [Bacteroidota bacterium]
MSPILILIGTQTGNSERVADDVAEALGEAGHTSLLVDMADAVPEMLAEHDRLIVVLCTWAEGTFPDNTVEFYDSLVALAPDLSHLAYGTIGLGDHLYDPYFLTASYRLEDRLDRLGATRAAPIFEINGGPSVEDLDGAQAWALRCAEAFERVRTEAG